MGAAITAGKTIYGGRPETPAAYCHLHNGCLSVHELRRKNCLGKQCRYFEKNPAHPFWRERERIRQKRKELES